MLQMSLPERNEQPATFEVTPSVEALKHVPRVNSPGACLYRAVDVTSDQPIAWARIELEPVSGGSLPHFNGQTDVDGWFRQTGVPPGEYNVSVRARGYVPVQRVRNIEPGATDDLALFMAKP